MLLATVQRTATAAGSLSADLAAFVDAQRTHNSADGAFLYLEVMQVCFFCKYCYWSDYLHRNTNLLNLINLDSDFTSAMW